MIIQKTTNLGNMFKHTVYTSLKINFFFQKVRELGQLTSRSAKFIDFYFGTI